MCNIKKTSHGIYTLLIKVKYFSKSKKRQTVVFTRCLDSTIWSKHVVIVTTTKTVLCSVGLSWQITYKCFTQFDTFGHTLPCFTQTANCTLREFFSPKFVVCHPYVILFFSFSSIYLWSHKNSSIKSFRSRSLRPAAVKGNSYRMRGGDK